MSLDWFKFALDFVCLSYRLNCDYVLTFHVSISVQTINEIGAFTSPKRLGGRGSGTACAMLTDSGTFEATMEAEVITTIIGYTNAYC